MKRRHRSRMMLTVAPSNKGSFRSKYARTRLGAALCLLFACVLVPWGWAPPQVGVVMVNYAVYLYGKPAPQPKEPGSTNGKV